MQTPQLPAPDGMTPTHKFGIGDIYYTLFRHKWKIALCTVLGLAAAAAYFTTQEPLYQSDAKLFVRYVVSESSVLPGQETDTKVFRGGGVLGSEAQIVESMDLAMKVAETYGPSRILGLEKDSEMIDSPENLTNAAAIIRNGIKVWTPQTASTLIIAFQHHDPTLVQPVLQTIVRQYLKLHLAVHSARGEVGNFLAQETDQLRSRLARTETDLKQLKQEAGVVNSVAETYKQFSEDLSTTQEELFRTQIDLAQKSTLYEAVAETIEEQSPDEKSSEAPEVEKTEVPRATLEALRRASNRVAILENMEQELLTRYTPENSQVQDVKVQIAEATKTREGILAEYPELTQSVEATISTAGREPNKDPGLNPKMIAAEISALQTKREILQNRITQLQERWKRVNDLEDSITELQRRKEMQEINYRNYATSLEQSRITATLGNESLPNISQIQSPSPAYHDDSGIKKNTAILALGGLIAGLAWAFALELFLDQRVRRPIEIESKLGIPFFLSLPYIGTLRIRRDRRKMRAKAKKNQTGDTKPAIPDEVGDEIPALSVFYETLRDRLGHFFESRMVEHKPKLIAITGLDHGAGVSSLAAGLTRSISQSHEGNVLLVDLTGKKGSARRFMQGDEIGDLDQLLTNAPPTQVEENLFMVSESGSASELSRHLPKRFSKLIPWLKTSNFDYIIFDMPVVSQISITPRLAGLMDMVLVVLESEKTDREMAKKAAKLLGVSQQNVAAVLNKTRNYVPQRIHREFSLTH